jgi:23S rRNA pseudouridine2605 synthase
MSKDQNTSPDGERIAKVLARAGVASRREAERMIEAGRVSVNGKVIDSPALNVGPRDKIMVDEAPLADPEPPRLWLYHKPTGLVTTAKDEKGRETVFDALPEDMPRVMSVGRLDLNSEGLLLLTNDGAIKRQLELPATGWVRKYRVRVKGEPTEDSLTPLRKGLTVDGERFQPMGVSLDRQQGANAWLTVSLREGKNREIRRAMEAIGLTVNRLLRVSYGPFRLGDLKAGEVEEVRARVLRDQLGLEETPVKKPVRARKGAAAEMKGERPARGKPGDKPGDRAGDRAGKPGRSAGKPGAGNFGKPGKAGKAPGAPRATGPGRGGRPGGKPAGKPTGSPTGKPRRK